MNWSAEQLLDIAQYSLIRLDGAWFMAMAGRLGKETAWDVDVDCALQVAMCLSEGIELCQREVAAMGKDGK